jgi:hypothetical protein
MPHVQREPRGTYNRWLIRDYDAILDGFPASEIGVGYVRIGFDTNPDGEKGSRYWITIGPDEFNELARAMMTAGPTPAIKAFGVALQETPEIPLPAANVTAAA